MTKVIASKYLSLLLTAHTHAHHYQDQDCGWCVIILLENKICGKHQAPESALAFAHSCTTLILLLLHILIQYCSSYYCCCYCCCCCSCFYLRGLRTTAKYIGVNVPVMPPLAQPIPPCCSIPCTFDVPAGASLMNSKNRSATLVR
jgi:hypothetical protein